MSPEVHPSTYPPTPPAISQEALSNKPLATTTTISLEESSETSLAMTSMSSLETTSTIPSTPIREMLPISSSKTTPEPSLETSDVTVVCPHPGNIKHGIAQPDHPHRDFLVGEKVTYTCEETFVHQGAKEIICLGNSTWSDKIPACVPLGSTSDKGNKLNK